MGLIIVGVVLWGIVGFAFVTDTLDWINPDTWVGYSLIILIHGPIVWLITILAISFEIWKEHKRW